jgi:two-component system response regulator AtoC
VTTEANASVLVVDDDPAVGKVLAALLGQAGIACRTVGDAPAALLVLGAHPIDVVVTDLRMPGPSGVDLLQDVTAKWPEIPVIMLTAHGNVGVAVEAMKKGAADFLLKPFDREEILFAVRKQIAAAHRDQARPPESRVEVSGFDSASPAMREAQGLIRRAATSNATVLLRGESGTGKDWAAKAIHHTGSRQDTPFVRVQCAALPDTLIESELFGYEKGAFTGAASRRPGRVELAEGGTLFLDEIGDITPVIQIKLLRLLQEREFERLGGTQTLKTTARFVAATHQPLEDLIKRGTFREDLFYRLNVLPIWIPPLRMRLDDLDGLAIAFAHKFGIENERGPLEIAPQGLALLRGQTWPGNVRQLQNFIERLVVLSDGDQLTGADVERELARQSTLGGLTAAGAADSTDGRDGDEAAAVAAGESGGGGATGTLEASRRDAERTTIRSALDRSKNNRARAARLLGISRRTLYHKLDEHGLT